MLIAVYAENDAGETVADQLTGSAVREKGQEGPCQRQQSAVLKNIDCRGEEQDNAASAADHHTCVILLFEGNAQHLAGCEKNQQTDENRGGKSVIGRQKGENVGAVVFRQISRDLHTAAAKDSGVFQIVVEKIADVVILAGASA